MVSQASSIADAPRCPVVHGQEFNPWAEEQVADPFPWLERAQREAPVFYIPDLDMWCVTAHEDVMAVVRDTKTFSSRKVIDVEIHPDVVDQFPHGYPNTKAMVTSDPPYHTKLRKSIQPAFTPKRVAQHEPWVRALSDELVDDFVGDGRCEMVSQYSMPLATRVVSRLVGIPEERRDGFVQWSRDTLALTKTFGAGLSSKERLRRSKRALAFMDWLGELVAERRETPVGDLTSDLASATTEDGGWLLDVHEIVAQLSNVLAAGAGTTAYTVPAMMAELLRHPDQWAAARTDPELVDPVVEETLRFREPVRGVTRLTNREVTLRGVTIPKDATLYVHYGAAQRDASKFADPHTFDVFRDDVGHHFSFGRGAHMCLGAPVARLELRVALKTFIERIPGIRLAADYEERWKPNILIPDPVERRFEWDVAASAT